MEWGVSDFIQLAVIFMAGVIAFLRSEGRIDRLNDELNNHKENHGKLEERVTLHESKIDDKLDKMNKKMDELKDLIIQRTEK